MLIAIAFTVAVCYRYRPLEGERIAALVGACAGFLLTAFHGSRLTYHVYDGWPGLAGSARAVVAFGAGGFLVTVFANHVTHRTRFVLQWVLAGLIVGPMIEWLSSIIAFQNRESGGLYAANLFAAFVGAVLGRVLGSDSVAIGDTKPEHR